MLELERDLTDLNERVLRMHIPPEDPDLRFHALTLTANAQGEIQVGRDTVWVGWQDRARQIELRRSRLVTAAFSQGWEKIGLPFVFVRDQEEMDLFFFMGGNGLVEKSIAEATFEFLTDPQPAYRYGDQGFTAESALPATALKRAPTPKVRMQVLNRDQRRCRICGRYPDDHVDLSLNVHHVRPWSVGGTTDPSNLITLCHTCHEGLDPHFDPSLFRYIHKEVTVPDYVAAYEEGVTNYRRAVFGEQAD